VRVGFASVRKLYNLQGDKLDDGRGASQLQSGASLPECKVHRIGTALIFVQR
jgi:hypothetical protein